MPKTRHTSVSTYYKLMSIYSMLLVTCGIVFAARHIGGPVTMSWKHLGFDFGTSSFGVTLVAIGCCQLFYICTKLTTKRDVIESPPPVTIFNNVFVTVGGTAAAVVVPVVAEPVAITAALATASVGLYEAMKNRSIER